MTTTHYEIRCRVPGNPAALGFSEGLGVVGNPIRYTTLRSAGFAMRRVQKETDLIPPGGKLTIFRIEEEEQEEHT